MFTIAAKPIDFNSMIDGGGPTADSLLAALSQAPDYVKQAEFRASHEDLADSCFALILTQSFTDRAGHTKTAEHRLFPVSDAASCWMQTEALRRSLDTMPEEAAKVASYHLSNAASRYGLSVPLALQQKAAGMAGCSNRLDASQWVDPVAARTVQQQAKTAAADPTHYALVDRQGTPRFPLHTAELVKKAQAYLVEHEHTLDPRDRWKLATQTALRAQALGVPVEAKTAQYSGIGWDEANARKLLVERAHQVKSAAEGTALAQLEPLIGRVEPEKFAALVHDLDQASGFNGADPYASTMTFKQAAAPARTSAADLDHLGDREIATLVIRHQDKMASYLGQGVMQSLCTAPKQTVETLDDEQRHVIEQIVAGTL